MRVLATAVAGALVLVVPFASPASSGCPNRDVRAMLVEAGQGMNGRVIELRETYITIVAESTYKDSVTFDETVRVYGRSLPGVLQGRIGIVARRDVIAGPPVAATSSRAGGWPTPSQICHRARSRGCGSPPCASTAGPPTSACASSAT